MTKLITVEKTVHDVLKAHPEARESDMELYYLVSLRFFILYHGRALLLFEDVMRNYRGLGIPCFESVRRARQKLQAKHPELGCSPEVRRARTRAQNAYRDYAHGRDGEDDDK